MSIKVCSVCRQEKPLTAFYKQKTSTDGLRGYCKDCYREKCRAYVQRHHQNGVCTVCGKPTTENRQKCRRCRYSASKANKSYYRRFLDKQRERGKRRKSEQKQRVVEAYGGRCVCCGETIAMLLTVDHKNGGGSVHRRQLRGQGIYQFLINSGFPKEGYQLLCWSCNIGKYLNGGVCPHQQQAS